MKPTEVPNHEKLSAGTKLAYGAGDLGPAIATGINGFLLNAFLLNIANLSPVMVGTIFLIVKIWDAVNDPIIGALTDRTRSKWGRRRPWLLFAAVPFALAFLLQWLVPPLGDGGKFWYYLVVAFLLDFGFTAVNVPYAAMTPELTRDYDERTSLSTYRLSFSILGSVLAVFFHTQIVAAIPDKVTGNSIAAAIWAAIFIISSWITFFFTRERHYEEEVVAAKENRVGFFKGLRIVFSNRAFVLVALIYMLSWLAIQFVQNNLQLYVVLWIKGEAYFPFLVLAVQVSAFLFLLMWNKISQKAGKQNIYYLGMSVWVIVCIVLFFVQPGQIMLLFILAILAAVGISIGYLVPWSMIPDVVELDELETGQRREGIFYGFFVFLQKLGLSLGLAISNYTLGMAGYISPANPNDPIPAQNDSVLLALRIFVSFAPAVILLISFLVVRAYPLTRQKHAELRARLEARKAASQVN